MTQIYTRAFVPPLTERPSLFDYDHYAPRSQASHTSTAQSQYSDNHSVRSTSQPRSPMSDSRKGLFEVTSPKVGDMYRSRQEGNQPRESLPPLSSLFGNPPPRPSSAYSSRPSPTFPAISPQEPRHPATPVHADRPYDTSYFHQRPPLAHPFTYGVRPEQTERLGLPPPPRNALPGHRTGSPRYDARPTMVEAPRAPYPASNWSPHSQSSRPEYPGRDTSSSFRTHMEHHPAPPSHRQELDSKPKYLESHAPHTPNYPPTPSSTGPSETVATKDGLGPKIWTGTHFLPRFVRQAEVPGEGVCYFYDDGTHCKTVIDGEVVNAHWGVTKAGKPRKRLAIACITCREKKIKCDPDYPRCVQCEKFGRVCKFKNAPRGGQGSPDTPPADPEDTVSRPGSSREDGESFREKRGISPSVSPSQVLRHDTPDSEVHHASKRQRTGYNEFTPVASEASPRLSVQEAPSPSTPFSEPFAVSAIDPSLIREWHTNPYSSNPALVTELIGIFFRHVPETAYCMFAEGPFKVWILSLTEKSLDDLTLIYTFLALATVFSPKPEHKLLGPQYSAISRFACENRPFSLQLVQSRLLLALYFFANNQPELSWDLCGAALCAASALKLNLEMDKADDAYRKTFPYGLTRSGFAECRRRTFWSCYLMDRFNGFCSGHLSVLHPEDIFLRLPCDVNSFENQADVENPFFDHSTPPIENTNWTIGSMAYLINIATIWGDVTANIYRSSQRSSSAPGKFTAFYETMNKRLQDWDSSLPSCYTFSADNVKRAASNGKLGTFMTMHSVYHNTHMKLNRFIAASPTLNIPHHQAVAKHHAEAFLDLVETLISARNVQTEMNAFDALTMKFSSPFVGYTIVSAIDILTSKFTIAGLPRRLSSFRNPQLVLKELACFWQSSKNQMALVQKRVDDLTELLTLQNGGTTTHLGHSFRDCGEGIMDCREPIDKTFERNVDVVYN